MKNRTKFTLAQGFAAVIAAIALFSLASCEGPTTYTVAFSANGGSGTAPAPSPETVTAGSSITLPNEGGLSKDGYVFGGWNTRADGTGTDYAAGSSYTVTGTITLYAKWIAVGTTTYMVTFDSNGGSGTVPATQTVTAGSSITLPGESGLTRIGFVFVGWDTNASGTGTDYSAGAAYTPSANTTLYARWVDSTTTYTVTFSANGGSGTVPGHQIVIVGSSITLPNGNVLSRTGFTFGGWNTNASGTGTTYNAGDSYTVTGNATLYARWEGTVTFYLNGGGWGTPPSAQTASAGSSITLPGGSSFSFINDYTFVGWSINADGTGTKYNAGDLYTVTGNATLYARWEGTVTFNINGGWGTPPSAQTASAGSSITLPGGSGLSKTGYTFVGWSINADGTGTKYNAGNSYTVTGNATLYARWEGGTVTFDINGGWGTPPSAQTASAGSSITLPGGSGLTKTGYTFGGWNTNSSGTGTNCGSAYTVTGTITLYAKWVEVVVSATGVEMVRVSGGSFEMGKNLGTVSYDDVTPVHTVTVSGFYMGRTEVTQAQYQAVMGSNPSNNYFSYCGVGNNYPVYNVSWYDALVFCNKLSTNEGLTPAYRINNSTDTTTWGSVPTSNDTAWDAATIDSNANGYRLPTEAQWEYAAKGGNTGETFTYSGSDIEGDVAWYFGNSEYRTHEVGTKFPNGLGLYDMSGNVYEWCWDWYGSYLSGAQTNPTGASSGAARVRRGGGWDGAAVYVRSTYRDDTYPGVGADYLGFRLVRP